MSVQGHDNFGTDNLYIFSGSFTSGLKGDWHTAWGGHLGEARDGGRRKNRFREFQCPFQKPHTCYFGLTKCASTPIYMQIHRYLIGSVWGRSRVNIILHCGVGIIQNV